MKNILSIVVEKRNIKTKNNGKGNWINVITSYSEYNYDDCNDLLVWTK